MQMDMFGEPSRLERIEFYIESLPEGILKRWLSACYFLAGSKKEFTVEDVRFVAGAKPERNAEGPIMLEAKRLGVIKPLRYTISSRPEAKGRRIPVYTRGWT